MLNQIDASTDFLKKKITHTPRIGMITGTGLGNLTDLMKVEFRVPYEEIPHFPKSTIEGHKGSLVYGRIGDVPALVMEGRFHIYEGYSPQEATFPVRVMARLGADYLLISSAAGGLNPLFKPGDLMLLTDHINLTGKNPLIGPNLDQFGPRFPDMSEVYDPELITLVRNEAIKAGIFIREGVYTGIIGPSLETPAETRYLKMIGGDAVGMSTVLEVIVGVHCQMKIIAIVAITNVNLPDCMKKTSLEQVIATAEKASQSLSILWTKVINKLP